jgi:hypothetical protein
MRRRLRLGGPMLALLLAACSPAPTLVLPSGAVSSHEAHDPALARAEATLAADHGMTFAAAGPHHVTGTDPAGNQLDFVGAPVEEVVLTLDATDPDAARAVADAYLPIARDLLHGPRPVWTWVEDGLACRAAGTGACEASSRQGNLAARFTDDGPEFWVVAISRD